jgi:hypothetical protein
VGSEGKPGLSSIEGTVRCVERPRVRPRRQESIGGKALCACHLLRDLQYVANFVNYRMHWTARVSPARTSLNAPERLLGPRTIPFILLLNTYKPGRDHSENLLSSPRLNGVGARGVCSRA